MSRARLKKSLREREALFGAWISYDHPSIAETFAIAGFDFISIDMEHSPISLASAQRIISISQAYNIPCLPRPVSHSNDFFKPLLDSGADGLTIPMIETYDEVSIVSNYLKYPPIGKRTFGVNRAQSYGLKFDEYIQNWNEHSILVVQIESKRGIENIEEIASHPSVDALMIGPYDLSGSYSVPGETDHQLVKDASLKVIRACERYGKSCGTQIANPTERNVKEAFDQGYTYIVLGSDLFALSNWARDMKKIINIY